MKRIVLFDVKRLLARFDAGTPTGIDLRRVVETGTTPVINTGIAHREAGVGQIGAGITTAPMECFVGAIAALAAARSGGRG